MMVKMAITMMVKMAITMMVKMAITTMVIVYGKERVIISEGGGQ